MGFFSGLKKTVGKVGDVVKKVAPVAAFIPGIGPGIAAAAGGIGGIVGTLNDEGGFDLGRGLKDGALSAISAYGAGKLGSAVKQAGGITKAAPVLFGKGKEALLGKALPPGRGGTLPGGLEDPTGGLTDLAPSIIGGRGGGILSGAFDWVKKHPDLALAGAGMVNNAMRERGQDKLRNEAIDIARQQNESQNAMRELLMQRLASGGVQTGNPFAQPPGGAVPVSMRLNRVGG